MIICFITLNICCLSLSSPKLTPSGWWLTPEMALQGMLLRQKKKSFNRLACPSSLLKSSTSQTQPSLTVYLIYYLNTTGGKPLRPLKSAGLIWVLRGMEFEHWRFNLRSSANEPVLRLNIECRADTALLQEKKTELTQLFTDI